MKKILLFTTGLLLFCQGYSQELLDSWTLHYMVINGVVIDVPQPGPPNILYHPKIEFYESSQGYEVFASISPDNNYFFESQPPMTIEADTFTIQVGSVTLGNCPFYCDLEINYLGTILAGINRTFNYEITTAGNGDRTLTITSPEGNIAVHGDFILSADKLKQPHLSISPNPANDVLQINLNELLISNISVFSIDGKKVSQIEYSGDNTLDVSYLKSGLYFIEITTFDNRFFVEKFIKK